MQQYFQITPPRVRSRVLTLERLASSNACRARRCVENGVKYTNQYGDTDERFYSSIESTLGELAALLRGEARELYPQFSTRLANVERRTDGIGWAFHDVIADAVGQLEKNLGTHSRE